MCELQYCEYHQRFCYYTDYYSQLDLFECTWIETANTCNRRRRRRRRRGGIRGGVCYVCLMDNMPVGN